MSPTTPPTTLPTTPPRLASLLCCLLVATLIGFAGPSPARASCGFYVAGADTQLFNDATMVVMMRDGKRTISSMQNAYEGPPEDFAMVVPVPVVLQEDDVKILPQSVFDRVDQLAAPRLVEYWEFDPCAPMPAPKPRKNKNWAAKAGGAPPADFGVKIEAQFEVGEYEVVVLSAADSTGLDAWLRQEDYRIPTGAEPILRPYVESGHKFFVAKVDVDKVKFVDGRVALSPLRVHYDADDFSLPIRLGLINSGGTQDLIVADPIVGGREHVVDDKGALERGAVVSGTNNFQARYIIRHRWNKAISCKNPIRGRWAGPWDQGSKLAPSVAKDLAFVARGAKIASYVRKSDHGRTTVELLSEGDASLAPAPIPPQSESSEEPPSDEPPTVDAPASPDPHADAAAIDDGPDPGSQRGCAHCSVAETGLGVLGLAGLLGGLGLGLGRRRRSQ